MKRAVLRSIGCAHLLLVGLALFTVALPTMAQQAASPAPAVKAVKKPAAKPAVRHWTRYYPRWSRYSRWGHRTYAWKKPTVWAKPVAAKPGAVKYAPKYASKPAAKTLAKPAAWNAAASAKTGTAAKPAPVKPATAAKPAAKSSWTKPAAWAKSAAAAKTTAWAKPAAKPAAWAKPFAKPASAAPAAKGASAKPLAKVVKPAAAHSTARQAAQSSLTRDAYNGSSTGTAVTTIAGAGQLDFGPQIKQTVIATLVVLLLIIGGFALYRRYYKAVPAGDSGAAPPFAQAAKSAPGSDRSLLFGLLSGQRANTVQASVPPMVGAEALGAIGPGGLQILGAQTLPGSGTLVYLVRIEDHIVLLGASYAGGVRLLAEWENEAQAETAEEKSKFESYLREQGMVPEAQREEEEHTFATIRARLNSTADRLAGLRAGFGG